MAEIRALARVDSDEVKELKLIRDRAYTHLKAAVDEIRTCVIRPKASPFFRNSGTNIWARLPFFKVGKALKGMVDNSDGRIDPNNISKTED